MNKIDWIKSKFDIKTLANVGFFDKKKVKDFQYIEDTIKTFFSYYSIFEYGGEIRNPNKKLFVRQYESGGFEQLIIYLEKAETEEDYELATIIRQEIENYPIDKIGENQHHKYKVHITE